MSSGGEAVLAQLLGGRLVRDDEGDLVQRVAERAGDAGDRAVDERGERDVPRGARPAVGVTGAAAALRHGARILAAMAVDPVRPIEPWAPDVALAPGPDVAREPEGFVVAADDGSRLHFLDWGAPGRRGRVRRAARAGAAPAGRVVGACRAAGCPGAADVVSDLRGQGLSDSPMSGYDLGTLASDAVAVAEGSGLLGGGRIVVAGHGFGGIVALVAAAALGERCAGVVLVDGGWERLEVTTDVDVDEFLRGLDEPPEVLRSLDAYLADRRGYDPSTWDADQERAARDSVVETAAGHVVRAVRPHVVEALVHTMFEWDPAEASACPRPSPRWSRSVPATRTRASRSCAARPTRGGSRPAGPSGSPASRASRTT